ncbi:MAG: PLP-dependent transferase, partial [Pseudomonadota bacterium]|nr:PLP-dependent transferase [Pseudomonadota bacterium]
MAGKDDPTLRSDTRLVTSGRSGAFAEAVVNPPVWRASTHLYASCADLRERKADNRDGQFFYGRRGAPTQWALSEALTALEPGAAGTVLYPSGLAALSAALLAVLRSGDVLLVADNAYDPTRSVATGLLKGFGIEHRFFDPLDLEAYEAAFCDRTRAVMLEVPGSLTMEVCDIPALARIAREKGAVSLVDNTWATALGFPALERGCDIAITALTKHVGGHSDVMMGAASAGERWYRRLRLGAQQLGHVVSPDDAALVLRGLRTMSVRLERETASALAIAGWLAEREEVAHVLSPLLPGP